MVRIALILMAITAIVLGSLYSQEAKKVIAASKLLNKSSAYSKGTQQNVYKWQDEQGQWHLSDTAPKGIEFETVRVNSAANVIPSVKLPNESVEVESQSKPKLSLDKPAFVPATVNPMQIPELIHQAQDVERLLQVRKQALDQAL